MGSPGWQIDHDCVSSLTRLRGLNMLKRLADRPMDDKTRERLKERMKEGAIAHSERDRSLAEEWLPLDEEAALAFSPSWPAGGPARWGKPGDASGRPPLRTGEGPSARS